MRSFISVCLLLTGLGCADPGRTQTVEVRPFQQTGLTWYAAGDNHVHLHGCASDENETPASLVQRMKDTNTNVASALIWGAGIQSDWQYFRGQLDDPASQPDHILHWDFEISDLPGNWNGHMMLVNLPIDRHPVVLGQPTYPGRDYLLPNYDWAQSGGGIVGYAHGGVWPVGSFQVAPSGVVPRELPLDVALTTVDFLSTEFEVPGFGSVEGFTWLWYQMLNAGFHITPAAGSDFPCIRDTVGVHTMFPLADGESLSYAAFVDSVRDGRTVIRNSLFAPDDFLDLRVNGTPLGGELSIQTETATTVEVEVDASSSLPGAELVLLVNGAPVASTPITASTQTYAWTIPIAHSSWIAARTEFAHTAATFVLLNDCPIRNDPNAAFNWMWYLERYFDAGAESFGNSRAEVRQRVNQAQLVWWDIAWDGWVNPPLPDVPPRVCEGG